jgi:predicted PurR-regulated permease PerM
MGIENKVIRILYVILLSVTMLVLVSPFYIPIIFAATVSLALYPLLLKLERKGIRRSRAASLLTALFGVVISIPLFFFIIKGTVAITSKLEKMSINKRIKDQGVQELVWDIRHHIIGLIKKFTKNYEVLDFLSDTKIDQYLEMVNSFLLNFFRGAAAGLPTMVILLLIMILCTFSFLNNAQGVRNFFQKLTGFSDKRMDDLALIYIKDSRQVYMSNIITGGVQSLLVAIGVSLLGLGDFFLVFFSTLILSFIPVIGAAPVAFLFALLAFIRDKNSAAIILLILGLVTGVVDNILRPWLASYGESKIPPIVAFVCVIGGALLLGFPGLFIGLLVGSIAYDTLPIFWEELNSKK